ncbi:MAG: ethanolamine utilization protein EutN [Deltaproteobacteria bacterium]|nr:ethanolamine utilization protein EutN [Deltaproteobacteria bacterium]
MKLARVVGTVVATRKDPKLEGLKFYLLDDLDRDLKPKGSIVVAADSVGCGVGELVLYASGSSARQTTQTDKKPCDATVMAIIDSIDTTDGVGAYSKVNDG